MTIQPVDIYVKDDTINHNPIEGVVVRVHDSTGTTFIMQGTTDVTGRAGFSLVVPVVYQARFFKERVSITQPQNFTTVDALNVFTAIGHVYTPPEAVHPRLCRCSGFFKRPDSSPAINHIIHVIAKFDPILFMGDAMLAELLKDKTDPRGFVQFDLVRFGQYEVTVEGFEDRVRVITIPDAPSVNLPDLLFPVVESVTFDIPGPWGVAVGPENEIEITPVVHTSDGRVLPGTATQDVRWKTTDASIAAVLANSDHLYIRGLSSGSTQLIAERNDVSIIRIPNPPIQGIPVDIFAS